MGTTPSSSVSYTYDRDGNLASASVPGEAPVTYVSDGDGLRQNRSQGATTKALLWNVASDMPLLLDDGDFTYLYGPSATPLAQINADTGVVQYLHADQLGSAGLITDASGDAVGTYRYTAYGTVDDHDGVDTASGFTGGWTDSATRLVYLRARDYDPATGQFVQVDPAIGSTRRAYAYVGNNPLGLTDPTGLCGSYPTPGAQCSEMSLWDKALTSGPANWLTSVLTTGPTGEASNFAQGIGNGASFGLTGQLRQALAPDYACQADQSGFYAAGTATGAVASIAATAGAGAGGISLGSRVTSSVASPTRVALADARLNPELGSAGSRDGRCAFRNDEQGNDLRYSSWLDPACCSERAGTRLPEARSRG